MRAPKLCHQWEQHTAKKKGDARARHLNGKLSLFCTIVAGAVRSSDKLLSCFYKNEKRKSQMEELQWRCALLFPTCKYVWRRLPYAMHTTTHTQTQPSEIGSYKFAFVYQLWNGRSNFVFILASIICVVAKSPLCLYSTGMVAGTQQQKKTHSQTARKTE